jgi:hypothetical protein
MLSVILSDSLVFDIVYEKFIVRRFSSGVPPKVKAVITTLGKYLATPDLIKESNSSTVELVIG